MYPDQIKKAQRVLRSVVGYRGKIDGLIGRQTLAAANRVPGIGTVADFRTSEAKVIFAAQLVLSNVGGDVGQIDGHWGPQTDAAYLLWSGVQIPSRKVDLAGRFGPAGSPRCTSGVIRVPWAMFLSWNTSVQIREIRCHELIAGSGQRAFDRIAAAYSPAQIDDLGLNLFGGCYNFRKKRGGRSLSTHAYGVALDFDPPRNQLTWGADRARLAQRDAVPFWQAWEAEGWFGLGRARNFDWMHVQAVGL